MSVRKRYVDPQAVRFEVPTFPRGAAPAGWFTSAQLARRGLAPASRAVGQLGWRTSAGERFDPLYPAARAVRTGTSTAASTQRSRRAARCTCRTCGASETSRLPVVWGEPRCPVCTGAAR